MESYASPGDAAATLAQLQATARAMSGWLKFLGIVNIVVSLPGVIVLVGLLGVWLGYLLFKAGEAAGDVGGQDLPTMLDRLRTYFVVTAILTIVGVAFAVLYIIILLTVGLAFLRESGFDA